MTYNSLYFVAFFAVFLIVYLLMPNIKLRQSIILLGNLFFYRYAGGLNALVIVISVSLIVYIISRLMERVYLQYESIITKANNLSPKEQMLLFMPYKKRCKKFLLAGVVFVLAFLIYIKIGKMAGWNEVFDLRSLRFKAMLIPLGISYYTFSSVGYLLDIYWRKTKCEHNYFKLLLCITYFPIIVEGPISRYDKLMDQFTNLPGPQYERVCYGLQLMLWGFFKKMVVADRLLLYTSTIFGDVSLYAGVEILLAVLFNAIAIYADFSGCIDIVSGAAQAMGVTLDQNFRQPFFSLSAAEFWRRWHITLGSWFKDYVYMPIAMNPKFLKCTFKIRKKFGMRAGQIASSSIPLIIVWFLTGLWHGTGADYIAWGIYWGVLIITGSVLTPEIKRLTLFFHINTETFSFKLFQMIRTFLLFCIGRMLTATGSLQGFCLTVRQLFTETRLWVLFDGSLYAKGLDQKNFYVAFIGICTMWIVDILHSRYQLRKTLAEQPLLFRWLVYYSAIAIVLVFGMYGSVYDASAFIYGGF